MDLNIKELRERLGLSQQELADQTGISKGRINNWERGKGKPKVKDHDTLKSFFESNQRKSISRETKQSQDDRQLVIDTLIKAVDAKDQLISVLNQKIAQLEADLKDAKTTRIQ